MKPEFVEVIRRSLARMHDAHVHDLAGVLEQSLSVIHPNQRRTGAESLYSFKSGTLNAMNQHLDAVQRFILDTLATTNTVLTAEDVEELISLVRGELDATLYKERFQGYEAAFGRHVGRYGSSMRLTDFRPDVAKASLTAGTSNRITAFCGALRDQLLVNLESQRNARAGKAQESVIDQVNRFIKLEPNVFGIGFNLNYLIRRLRGKKE